MPCVRATGQQDGHILLSDFGVSKRLIFANDMEVALGQSVELREVTTRTIVGTPDYMAPEVLRGEPYKFSADWWAAGVLLTELLTGRTPFGDLSLQVGLGPAHCPHGRWALASGTGLGE